MRSFRWRHIEFTTMCLAASSVIPLVNAYNEVDIAKATESVPGLLGTIYGLVGRKRYNELNQKPLAYAALAHRTMYRGKAKRN